MEHELGEKFDYYGVTLKVVKHKDCAGCYFDDECIFCGNIYITGSCESSRRKDKKDVIFKKV